MYLIRLVLLLASSLLFLSCIYESEDPCLGFGDINGDGYWYTSQDREALLKFLRGETVSNFQNHQADLNSDCIINELDLFEFDKRKTNGFPYAGCCEAVSCCVGIRGDVNGDGFWAIGDVTYLAAYIYRDGPPPECFLQADVNGDFIIDDDDLTYLANFRFTGGPPPVDCPE